MLVGEQNPTSGHIAVSGTDITVARRAAMDSIGYCPQTDALFERLTGREVLQYYAALSDAPRDERDARVAAALQALELQRHANVQTRHFSGGTRRRLSLAVAYIMGPRVVALDEPSTGVDPVARRRMFALIDRAKAGRTTVLTTHVMEDADALSTRIGIMRSGHLACIGTPTHLKRRFGRGYVVEVHVEGGGGDAAAALTNLLAGCADDVALLESNNGHFRFEADRVRLGPLFRALEAARSVIGILDYAVSQTTLEQVFLRLTRPPSQTAASVAAPAAAAATVAPSSVPA